MSKNKKVANRDVIRDFREREKRKEGGTWVTVVIIVCLLVVFALFYAFLFDKYLNVKKTDDEIIDFKENNNIKKYDFLEARKLISKVSYPLAMNDEFPFNNLIYYYRNDKITVDDLSDEEKLLIVIQAEIKNADCGQDSCFISKDIVNTIYKNLFGKNEEIKEIDNSYITIANNYYEIDKSFIKTTSGNVFINVFDALYNDKELKIYTKVAFEFNGNLYRDSALNKLIEEKTTCKEDGDLEKYDNLITYVYTFKREDNNFIFEKIEKR